MSVAVENQLFAFLLPDPRSLTQAAESQGDGVLRPLVAVLVWKDELVAARPCLSDSEAFSPPGAAWG